MMRSGSSGAGSATSRRREEPTDVANLVEALLRAQCQDPGHVGEHVPGGLDADLGGWQAGFIDTTGRFMDRREAAAAVGHAGRLESRSFFAGDREPTLEAGHAESFRRAA